MMSPRSLLNRIDFAGLKAATRRLVEDAGGIEAAAAACRLSMTTLHRQYNPLHPETMPIDVVAELERASGTHPVTAALARLAGQVLVPVHHEPGAHELLRRLGDLMAEVGATMSEGAAAMEDGVLTDDEREALAGRLHEVIRVASSVRTWLRPPEGGLDERDRDGGVA